MPHLEALGQFADGGLRSGCASLNGQQGLMLLRLDAASARSLLAERQKAANLIA
jgi:hypothetical protein